MTALDGLGSVAAVARQVRAYKAGKRDDYRHRLHIRLVMISNDRFRLYLRTGRGPTKKGFCTRPIPFVTQEHIDDLSVSIYRTIQVQFSLTPKAEHFIDSPCSSHPPSVPAERGGQLGATRLHPVQHRAGRDINVTLGSQPYDLSGREW